MSAAKTRAQSLINDNAVVVFSKSYCPYCDSSKKLLDGLNAKYTALELDQDGKSFYFDSLCYFLYSSHEKSGFSFDLFSISDAWLCIFFNINR